MNRPLLRVLARPRPTQFGYTFASDKKSKELTLLRPITEIQLKIVTPVRRTCIYLVLGNKVQLHRLGACKIRFRARS